MMMMMIPLRSVTMMILLLPREVPVVDTARNPPNIRKSENENMMIMILMTMILQMITVVTTIVGGGITTNGARNHPKRSTKSEANEMPMEETIVMVVITGFRNSFKNRTDGDEK